MAKKKIIRLTESEFHNVMESALRNMVNEEFQEYTDDIYNDILNAQHIDKCVITFDDSTYGEGEMEIIGGSGTQFLAKIYATGEYTQGQRSMDYDVPDDEDETDARISDIELSYYDEEQNEYVELPSEISNSENIKDFLMNYIEFDWSDYDPYNDHFE